MHAPNSLPYSASSSPRRVSFSDISVSGTTSYFAAHIIPGSSVNKVKLRPVSANPSSCIGARTATQQSSAG